MRVPEIRIRTLTDGPPRPDGDFVLYWMVAARRPGWNFALQRAAEHARSLGRPLLVLEPLRVDHPHASRRLHRFVLDGMADNARALRGRAAYYPYAEPAPGAGKGLLEALADRACAVVTDDWPAYFLPRMVAAAARRLRVRMEAVDSNGLLPVRAADRAFTTAYHFRRFLQRSLRPHLVTPPLPDPLDGLPSPPPTLPAPAAERWPPAAPELVAGAEDALAGLPIDPTVPPVPDRGGAVAAALALRRFLDERLPRYAEARAEPAERATSELSPWLHFGHLSVHETFAGVMESESWEPDRLASDSGGRREGWWGVSRSAEAFLEQLITWRELGFNGCAFLEDAARWESLPAWARATLEKHASDPRARVYAREDLEAGRTEDPVWNAAQTQLRVEGRIHNSLRMLWGKRVLEWIRDPREALAVLFELNDRWAVDGRDPNSASGICWCFGRYDRAWGPERPVYGKVRYLSSGAARRKYDLEPYLEVYGGRPG